MSACRCGLLLLSVKLGDEGSSPAARTRRFRMNRWPRVRSRSSSLAKHLPPRSKESRPRAEPSEVRDLLENPGSVFSLGSSAPFLHPEDIDIISAVFGSITDKVQILSLNRRTSARVQPFFDFGMTIGERESASAVMIAGGHINDLPGARLAGIPAHVDDEITVVDAVFSFIQENCCARWPGRSHVGRFSIGFPTLIERMPPYPATHRHTADARDRLALKIYPGAGVGWAFPNDKRLPAIRP